MTTATPAAEKTVRRFERVTCSRCGGTGSYSYCSMYGSVCFKCGGAKTLLTVRGQAAYQYLRKLRQKKARDVKVGDVVQLSGVTLSCQVYFFWAKVTAVEPAVNEGASLKDGVMVPYRTEAVLITATWKGQDHSLQTGPDSDVDTRPDLATRQAQLAAALDYQDTLTASGKVHPRGKEGVEADLKASARRVERRRERAKAEATERREVEVLDRQGEEYARQLLAEASERVERARNGGLTAAERAQQAEAAQAAANAWLIEVMEALPYQTDWVRGVTEDLRRRPVATFSPRCLEILQDIYARTQGGRRNSRAYHAAEDDFRRLAGLED